MFVKEHSLANVKRSPKRRSGKVYRTFFWKDIKYFAAFDG
jgi:hypothetical protein